MMVLILINLIPALPFLDKTEHCLFFKHMSIFKKEGTTGPLPFHV